MRARKAFAENTAPHDGKLRECHIVGKRASVEGKRNEKRVNEQRIVDKLADAGAGGGIRRIERRFVVRRKEFIQFEEAVDLVREAACDFAFEQGKIVRKTNPVSEGVNCRGFLRAEIKLVVTNAKLAQQFRERRILGSRGNEIRHRV